ncbi:MAG: F0F1 ATP synthase subunit B [Bacteroidia bacterium]|nr:F0F1 ATP synthase subunit B [Bacteroidia bacterium]
MGLVSPDYGTIFWMVLAFSVVFFILRKFAWGPVLKMLKERDQSIEKALQSAIEARERLSRLKSDHEKMLQEAHAERDLLISEARQIREQVISKARDEAVQETTKVFEHARQEIESEKLAAINEIRQQVASLSVDIAEKILKRELADRTQQEKLIKEQLSDLKFN